MSIDAVAVRNSGRVNFCPTVRRSSVLLGLGINVSVMGRVSAWVRVGYIRTSELVSVQGYVRVSATHY